MKTINVELKSITDVKSFVNIVNKYDFEVDLSSGRYVVDAKSIMGIFSINSFTRKHVFYNSTSFYFYLIIIFKHRF